MKQICLCEVAIHYASGRESISSKSKKQVGRWHGIFVKKH